MGFCGCSGITTLRLSPLRLTTMFTGTHLPCTVVVIGDFPRLLGHHLRLPNKLTMICGTRASITTLHLPDTRAEIGRSAFRLAVWHSGWLVSNFAILGPSRVLVSVPRTTRLPPLLQGLLKTHGGPGLTTSSISLRCGTRQCTVFWPPTKRTACWIFQNYVYISGTVGRDSANRTYSTEPYIVITSVSRVGCHILTFLWRGQLGVDFSIFQKKKL